jgi:predicted SAM-dependent methyltransferase
MKVIIGAGSQRWEGWVATQGDELNLVERETWNRLFGNRKADAFLCEHVFEHLTLEEGTHAAKILFDYLKPGGFARIAVPDRHFPDEDYQRTVQPGGPGPSDHPAADHKIVYGYRELTRVFERAGFRVSLLEYHDENGTFHLAEWDPTTAPIYRSSKLDHRNQGGRIVFASLIIDAIRPTQS